MKNIPSIADDRLSAARTIRQALPARDGIGKALQGVYAPCRAKVDEDLDALLARLA